MREIRFRAWSKTEMYYSFDDLTGFFKGLEPVSYVLMQYTGLKDKNGKEIFEGDILATSNDGKDGADKWPQIILGAVQWMPISCCYHNIPSDDKDSIYGFRYMEIIGNIYEHAFLLDNKS